MGNLVYPTLIGLAYDVERDIMAPPVTVLTTPSQREYRARDASVPRYVYTVSYEILRSAASYAELQTLVGFWNKVGGPFDTFLFDDVDDNTCTNELFGVGDGATAQFQLLRGFGGFGEAIYDLNGAPTIYSNGTPVSPVVSDKGLVGFIPPPASGVALTWSGKFYRRCRFLDDQGNGLQTVKFMDKMWSVAQLQFISVKP